MLAEICHWLVRYSQDERNVVQEGLEVVIKPKFNTPEGDSTSRQDVYQNHDSLDSNKFADFILIWIPLAITMCIMKVASGGVHVP